MRINARLDEDHSRKLSWLSERTGQGVTAVIKEAIDLYYRQAQEQQANALEILSATGFVGGAEADPNLSTDYKVDLRRALDAKHGHR